MSSKSGILIQDRYKVSKKLGSGAFGEIYRATDIQHDVEVAVKFEPLNTRFPQLYFEAKLYKQFSDQGIPKAFYYGQHGDYNVLVIELLGPTLEDLFEYCKRKFSVKTVLMLAIQMIQRIEYVHSQGILHRDIKPENFLIGTGHTQQQIFIIDFGLSKRYKDQKTQRHIPYRDNKQLTGTARYASLNTHLGIEQGRRDDLEQIGYVLIYFLKGSLPWQGLPAKNKEEKYEQIKIKKATTTIESLCWEQPKEIRYFLNYARKLQFEEKPDYSKVLLMFKEAFERENLVYDLQFDWVIRKKQLKQRIAAANAEAEQQKVMVRNASQDKGVKFSNDKYGNQAQFVEVYGLQRNQKQILDEQRRLSMQQSAQRIIAPGVVPQTHHNTQRKTPYADYITF